MYYGGACALASAAPVGEQYGAAMMAQSLAQGNQFATMTRPYHGGRRSGCGMIRGGRRSGCGMIRGGYADMTAPLAAVQEAVKNVTALATGSASAAPAAPAAPAPEPPAAPSASGSGSEMLKGGRRRKSRKGGRKSRKSGRKGRRSSRKMYYGGMAPMSIFGTEGTDVNRASAHLTGQDTALNEALAYSRANPQMGGRRRRRVRGGALLEGAPWSQTSSDMLLADSPAAAAQAAKMESPAWTGVQQGTFLG